MQTSLIELEGEGNINRPIRVWPNGHPERIQYLFTVRTERFELYTEGPNTGRHRFTICRGTWEAYEVLTGDGQRNVIVQRLF